MWDLLRKWFGEEKSPFRLFVDAFGALSAIAFFFSSMIVIGMFARWQVNPIGIVSAFDIISVGIAFLFLNMLIFVIMSALIGYDHSFFTASMRNNVLFWSMFAVMIIIAILVSIQLDHFAKGVAQSQAQTPYKKVYVWESVAFLFIFMVFLFSAVQLARYAIRRQLNIVKPAVRKGLAIAFVASSVLLPLVVFPPMYDILNNRTVKIRDDSCLALWIGEQAIVADCGGRKFVIHSPENVEISLDG